MDFNDYSGRDTLYSAQTMFGSHREGMDYGGLGTPGLGYVSDLNSAEDQTFDPTSMGYLGESGIPSVGEALPNLSSHTVAPPSHHTAMPRDASVRPSVASVRSSARRNTVSPDAAMGLAAGLASVTGLVAGSILQSKALKTQEELAAAQHARDIEATAAQAQLTQAQAALAAAQASPGLPIVPILLGVGGLAVVGGVIYFVTSRNKVK